MKRTNFIIPMTVYDALSSLADEWELSKNKMVSLILAAYCGDSEAQKLLDTFEQLKEINSDT